MRQENEPQNLEDARNDIQNCLEAQSRYYYTYIEYLVASILRFFSCCCKNKPCYKKRARRLKRHELAQDALTAETDFFEFLKLLRMSDLISKLYLKEYQRKLIPFFKKYQLTELDGDKKQHLLNSGLLGSRAQ